jgi:hypothetical protein
MSDLVLKRLAVAMIATHKQVFREISFMDLGRVSDIFELITPCVIHRAWAEAGRIRYVLRVTRKLVMISE